MGIKEKIAGLGTKTLIALAAFMVVVTAATVTYLSNAAVADVNVASPFGIMFTAVNGVAMGTPADTVSLSAHSGETFSVTADLTNKANTALKTKTKITCTDSTGLTCANLKGHVVMSWTGHSSEIPCLFVDANTVEFITNDGATAIDPGTYTNTIAMTTSISEGTAYSGDMRCTVLAVPAPA
jgi:hypothetical protein